MSGMSECSTIGAEVVEGSFGNSENLRPEASTGQVEEANKKREHFFQSKLRNTVIYAT